MQSKRFAIGSLAFAGMFGLVSQTSWAQSPQERLPSCLACDGEQGTSINPEVLSLGAQKAPYMEIRLYLYRERMNRNEARNEARNDARNDTMTGVRNADLGIMAELLSRPPPPMPMSDAIDSARMDRGRRLIRQHRCDICHNPDLSGRENVPRAAGQRGITS